VRQKRIQYNWDMAMDAAPRSAAQTAADLKAVISAERGGEPFLHARACDGSQRIFVLPRSSLRATIGRHADCDISLPWDPEVSRVHALVEHVGAQWVFVDDGLSRNGSFVEGARVIGRHRLNDGDRVCVGTTVLIFHDPEAREAESTARAPEERASVPLSPTQRKVLIALCRPVNDSSFATPATNRQIADEVFLSVDAVKAQLRILFERFGLHELPQNEKRARLASTVLGSGMLAPRDF
jgi:pSer/pThr/pTyr-binding forkhead associated (FHA) protein